MMIGVVVVVVVVDAALYRWNNIQCFTNYNCR